MSIVALLPLKENSERLHAKNRQLLGGRPLYFWIVQAVLASRQIDYLDIYSSSARFYTDLGTESDRVRWIQRPKSLDDDATSITSVISEYCAQSDANLVVLVHATSPFLRTPTIDRCIKAVIDVEYDSAFAALQVNKFIWYRGETLNYKLMGQTPRTQDLEPVLIEQGGLYIFDRTQFTQTHRRIGDLPYIALVDSVEGIDIDDQDDLDLANLLASSNLLQG